MEKENKTMRVRIIVNGNDVEVEAESLSYYGLKMATLGMLGFVKANAESAKGEIEAAINEELSEEKLQDGLAEILHDWVDKVCREEYELR